jgi:putative ABC transport system permease protein
VLDVPVVAGRTFTPGSAPDSASFVLNEAAARLLMAKAPERDLATPSDLVGEEMLVNGPVGMGGSVAPVLGVVQDFNMATLREAVEPARFVLLPDRFDTVLARVQPGAAEDAVGALRAAWAEAFPDALFEYRFTDAAFDAAYRSEERLGTLFTVFAGLAIFIACLGLFGLAAYAAEQRRKEIGIRKTLGATVPNLVMLLARDFVALVAVAALVAAPVAYLAMDRWLDDFAYRVELGPLLFVGAGLVALAVALATVSGQALRAATTDPVKALRYE